METDHLDTRMPEVDPRSQGMTWHLHIISTRSLDSTYAPDIDQWL